MTSNSERRLHKRQNTSIPVFFAHPAQGTVVVNAADMSEGGVFVKGPIDLHPVVGDVVSIKVKGMLQDKSPCIPLRVVRATAEGVALNFIPKAY